MAKSISPDRAVSGPLRTLSRAIGPGATARVLARFARQWLAREPFGHLDAPTDRDERLSRKQIAPAILLYRALRDVAPEQAYELTQAIVLVEGAKFLRSELGSVDIVALSKKPAAERETEARRIGARFFNSVMRWDEIGQRRVAFTVTACRFPPLCKEAGVPEIAPMFCAVDDAYFGRIDPRLELTRTSTIATGGADCPFVLERSDTD
jgi:hypothetical protein